MSDGGYLLDVKAKNTLSPRQDKNPLDFIFKWTGEYTIYIEKEILDYLKVLQKLPHKKEIDEIKEQARQNRNSNCLTTVSKASQIIIIMFHDRMPASIFQSHYLI